MHLWVLNGRGTSCMCSKLIQNGSKDSQEMACASKCVANMDFGKSDQKIMSELHSPCIHELRYGYMCDETNI